MSKPILALAALLALSGQALALDRTTAGGEWPVYGGDLGSRKYSPLDQIDAANVGDLEIAWIWNAPDNEVLERLRAQAGTAGKAPEQIFVDHFKGTPLMVKGVLYIRTQLGIVEAIDPLSGTTLWRHHEPRYLEGSPRSYGFTTRGLAYHEDAAGKGRIIFTTPNRRIVALDAATGTKIASFGKDGEVDLDETQRRDRKDRWWVNVSNQVPVIVNGVIVLGCVVTDSEASYGPETEGAKPAIPTGDIRGFDALTGRHLWTFHTVPEEGEFGVETWEDESWRWVGSTNAWSLLSGDEELGLVYVPLTSPTFNYYGGFRKGDNLFGNSLVALDARTGVRRWHFQAEHHPVFDYDLPAAPVLADLTVEGRKIKAVIQVSKNGFAYVFDRVTGTPVWPIEERPVPQSSVPGERTSPTQPFPTKPPPFAQQGIGKDSINRLTPELEAKALEVLGKYDHGSIFTPVSLRGTILMPGIGGGATWPGGAFDPETERFYVTAVNTPTIRGLAKNASYYGYGFRPLAGSAEGFPLPRPPWATITAYAMSRGEILFQVANGPGPKDHPKLKGLKLGDLGSPSKSNVMVTKTLLFAASTGEGVHAPVPPRSAWRVGKGVAETDLAALMAESLATFRAYDKATGALLWTHPIGPSFNDGGAPMTYVHQGRQYIVTPVGGGRSKSHLIAFALPQGAR